MPCKHRKEVPAKPTKTAEPIEPIEPSQIITSPPRRRGSSQQVVHYSSQDVIDLGWDALV